MDNVHQEITWIALALYYMYYGSHELHGLSTLHTISDNMHAIGNRLR